jgi:general secretion pathway protein A
MYTAYWNLKGNPFLNAIDRRYLFAGDQHEEAIARLAFLAENGRLAGALVGPCGVGKTTVLSHVAAEVEARYHLPVLRLDGVPGGHLPLTRQILSALKLDASAATLPEALLQFRRLADLRPDGPPRTVLLLDDVQHLGADPGLHFLRYLANLRAPNRKTQAEEPLFTLILAGTPDLLPAIQADPGFAQLIQILFHLEPLSDAQTTAYVQHHMRAVGGDIWSFDRPALEAIWRCSGGLPRRINLLCDTALMLGFAAKATQVSAALVEQAARDTSLAAPPPPEYNL